MFSQPRHKKKLITILGATGSVGSAAVDIILSQSEIFKVHAVTAGSDARSLAEIAKKLSAHKAVIADESKFAELCGYLQGTETECLAGAANIEKVASDKVDLVLAAIVGFAGLKPILSALTNGNNVAIANKEPLVAAGKLVMDTAQRSGSKIIPVDSEHNAIFQVFEQSNKEAIEKIILTASGGPFRKRTLVEMENATVEEAINHPNWSMGQKISIDSATMMNKALEIIEAHYLFDMPAEKIDVIIHPQSIIHSMVSYTDGSVLSQMGPSDMRVPVAHALAWPERLNNEKMRLDLASIQELTFERPDFEKFYALTLAYKCLRQGQKACIALNASNEVAVQAFLNKKIGFGDIMRCVTNIVSKHLNENEHNSLKTVEEIEEYDNMARRLAIAYIEALQNTDKHKKEVKA